MNTRFNIRYLTGGDDTFGPNFGAATVNTLTRAGYSTECPNVGRLLANFELTVDLENEWMDARAEPEGRYCSISRANGSSRDPSS